MRAARNFSYGGTKDGNDRKNYRIGDEVPKKVADDIDDSLILEKVAKSNPDSLTREQLMVMAGISHEDGTAIEGGEEASEDDFRKAMAEIKGKPALRSWAKEFFNLDLSSKLSRPAMEDLIVATWSGEPVDAEDLENQGEE